MANTIRPVATRASPFQPNLPGQMIKCFCASSFLFYGKMKIRLVLIPFERGAVVRGSLVNSV